MPTVSVIVPVYKVEKVLSCCIESILNQTFSDFELILVDDGSPDNSGEICDEYATKDKRIRVIHKENGGVSSARNTGMENAVGQYITFVDSDDSVCDTYLESFLTAKEKYPNVDAIWCSFYEITKRPEKRVVHSFADKNEEYSLLSVSDYMTIHKKWLAQMPWNKLYKLSVIKDNNLRMQEDISLGEDLLFNLDYLKNMNGNEILIINKPLVNYISDNAGSLDNKYYDNLSEIYFRVNSAIKECIDDWDISESEYEKYYDMVYFSYENVLRNTCRKENSLSFFKKLSYNKKIMKDEIFADAIKKMSYKLPFVYRFSYSVKSYLFIYLYESFLGILKK